VVSNFLFLLSSRSLLLESPSPPRFSAGEKVPKADEGAVAAERMSMTPGQRRAINRQPTTREAKLI
jgi:hypothetical protein